MIQYAPYDREKIDIPETDADFWLALMRVRDHYATAAADHLANAVAKTGRYSPDHIWFMWLVLNSYLTKAFHRCQTEK